MKTRIMLIVLAHIYIMCGCTSEVVTEVTALVDVTPEHIIGPDSEDIKSRLAVSSDRWAGSTFSLEEISDLEYNERHECSIGPSSSLLANLSKRKVEIAEFWNCLESALENFEDSAGRDHSSIYQPLVRELVRLTKSKATKRILLVYSDLQENSPGVFSVHDKRDYALLKKSPDTVLEKLATEGKLPDSLSGIEVVFIYHPKSVLDDERFSLMVNMLEKALTKRGAVVTVDMSVHIAHK